MASGPHQDDVTNLFAGRVYGDIVRNNVSLNAPRRLLAKRRAQPVLAEV